MAKIKVDLTSWFQPCSAALWFRFEFLHTWFVALRLQVILYFIWLQKYSSFAI